MFDGDGEPGSIQFDRIALGYYDEAAGIYGLGYGEDEIPFLRLGEPVEIIRRGVGIGGTRVLVKLHRPNHKTEGSDGDQIMGWLWESEVRPLSPLELLAMTVSLP